jgi:hypothetical protein
MLDKIIEMLKLTDHFGISEEIEIAKGKYKLSDNLKEIYKQEKRNLKFKKLNNVNKKSNRS